MTPDLAAEVAAALPGYEIGDELGRGAFGVVLAGVERQQGRQVAIKLLSRAFSEQPDVRHRFSAEARILGLFDHPHIVPVFDLIEEDGLCALVMELLPGGTVRQRLRQGALDARVACAVGLAACSALDYAHHRGVLHRDVKPDNLLFAADGSVKMTDFGIARVVGGHSVTRVGETVGTPLYMAPEQCTDQPLGPATDVYAAGLMLYELVAGQHPFHGSGDAMATMYRQIHDVAPPVNAVNPAAPEAFSPVIMRAMAKDPGARYPSALAFGAAIAEAAVLAWGDHWVSPGAARILSPQPVAHEASPPPLQPSVFLPPPGAVLPAPDESEPPSAESPPPPAQAPAMGSFPPPAEPPAIDSSPPRVAPPAADIFPPPAEPPAAEIAPCPASDAGQQPPAADPAESAATYVALPEGDVEAPAQPAVSVASVPLLGPGDAAAPPPGPEHPVAMHRDQAWPDQAWPDQAWPDQAWPDQAFPDQAFPDQAAPVDAPTEAWAPGHDDWPPAPYDRTVVERVGWPDEASWAAWGYPGSFEPRGPNMTEVLPYAPAAPSRLASSAPAGGALEDPDDFFSSPAPWPPPEPFRARRGLIALAVTAVCLAVVAVILLTTRKPAAPLAAHPPAKTVTPAQVAAALNQLIRTSATARSEVVNTVASIQNCSANAQAAASQLSGAIATRQQVVRSLQTLPVNELTDGAALSAAFASALNDSITADQSFRSWLAAITANGGCSGRAPTDADYQSGESSSAAADKAKQTFAALWNPLATSYGLPKVTSTTI